MIPATRLRPHPVCVRQRAHTLSASLDTPETERALPPTHKATGLRQRPRSVSGLTLLQWQPLPAGVLLRHRARHFARLSKVVDGFRPTYKRRDMLGAFLRMALLNANAAEIELDDKQIASIALTVDEETQRSRVVVRSKRGRKAS